MSTRSVYRGRRSSSFKRERESVPQTINEVPDRIMSGRSRQENTLRAGSSSSKPSQTGMPGYRRMRSQSGSPPSSKNGVIRSSNGLNGVDLPFGNSLPRSDRLLGGLLSQQPVSLPPIQGTMALPGISRSKRISLQINHTKTQLSP